MKKFFLLMSLLPVFVVAQDSLQEFRSTPVSDEELSRVHGDSSPYICDRHSDSKKWTCYCR